MILKTADVLTMGGILEAALRKVAGNDVEATFVRVASKSITEIGYDAETRTLSVVYNNGFVYTATEFPKSDFERLQSSDFDCAFPQIVLANYELRRRGRLEPLIR